jgi:hypothetical protein
MAFGWARGGNSAQLELICTGFPSFRAFFEQGRFQLDVLARQQHSWPGPAIVWHEFEGIGAVESLSRDLARVLNYLRK